MFDEIIKMVDDLVANVTKFFQALGKGGATIGALVAWVVLIWYGMKTYKSISAGESKWEDHIVYVLGIAVIAFMITFAALQI